jgi:hypothetical protein
VFRGFSSRNGFSLGNKGEGVLTPRCIT